jgi:hypothetical protein
MMAHCQTCRLARAGLHKPPSTAVHETWRQTTVMTNNGLTNENPTFSWSAGTIQQYDTVHAAAAAGCQVRDRTSRLQPPGNMYRAGPDLAAASGCVQQTAVRAGDERLETCISAARYAGLRCRVPCTSSFVADVAGRLRQTRDSSRGQVVMCSSLQLRSMLPLWLIDSVLRVVVV